MENFDNVISAVDRAIELLNTLKKGGSTSFIQENKN